MPHLYSAGRGRSRRGVGRESPSRRALSPSRPDDENPERWDCDCGYLWRILTPEQIRQKFAHLKRELKEGEHARRRAAKLEQDLLTAIPSAPHPPLHLAERYAPGRPRR